MPHVFELYRQASEHAGHLPGLGIGLSIVSQIVALHSGAVRVESPGVGLGSTFIVTLPMPGELSSGLATSIQTGDPSNRYRRAPKQPKSNPKEPS